jgi:hypothetical protein
MYYQDSVLKELKLQDSAHYDYLSLQGCHTLLKEAYENYLVIDILYRVNMVGH